VDLWGIEVESRAGGVKTAVSLFFKFAAGAVKFFFLPSQPHPPALRFEACAGWLEW
jgi:hypothetical protein